MEGREKLLRDALLAILNGLDLGFRKTTERLISKQHLPIMV